MMDLTRWAVQKTFLVMARLMAHKTAHKMAHKMALLTRLGMVQASAYEIVPPMRPSTKLGRGPSGMTLMLSVMWTGRGQIL